MATMTKKELEKLISEKVDEKAKELLEKENNLSKEAIEQVKEDIQQLKEALKESAKPPITGEDKRNEEKKFKSLGEYLACVRKAFAERVIDERLQKAEKGVFKTTGHLEEGQDSLGGFLVPEEYRAELLALALEDAVVRPRAWVLPMRTDTLLIPRIDDTSHASSVFGGVVAYWTAEAASKTEKNPKFGQVELRAKKLTGFTYASDELLADSAIGLEALIKRFFSEALRYYEDDAFLNGSGVGEPLGIKNAPCAVPVTRNTSGHFEYVDACNMLARLLPVCYRKAVWIISPGVLPDLLKMENPSAGTGGHLVYQPLNQGAKASPFPLQLLGRPVIVSEKVSNLGTAKDVYLVDFSYYIIGDRQDLAIQSSIHYRFAYDETTYRFVERVDGQPWLSSALTPKNSGSTLSPIVYLS